MTKNPSATDRLHDLLGTLGKDISPSEHLVLNYVLNRKPIARNVADGGRSPTFGERMADKVASFGGSWTFIGIFSLVLFAWIGLNAAMATRAFDPYPFVFLNLVLSTVAAVQAPIIMMSQNRQAEKDRIAAAHDYEVNLQAEIEIMALHAKIDRIRDEQFASLIEAQQAHINQLTDILGSAGLTAPPRPETPTISVPKKG